MLCNGEGPDGSETYVTLFGRQVDAGVVGGVTTAIAVAPLGVPAALVSRPRE